MSTKFFIDYDKHDHLEPALEMLDRLEDRKKAQNASGRIVEVEDGLADGLIAVLQAMGVQPEVISAPAVLDTRPAGDGWLPEINSTRLIQAAHELDADPMAASEENKPPVMTGVDFGSPAGDQTWISEIDALSPQNEAQNVEAMWRSCEICGEPFQPKRKDSRLCGKPECKKEDTRRRNQAEHQKFKAEVAAAIEDPQGDAAEEVVSVEPPFEEKDPRAIWTAKDSGLAPMTMMELQTHLVDKTIKPGTILNRMNSSFPWEVFEVRPGVLGVREVEGRLRASETTR